MKHRFILGISFILLLPLGGCTSSNSSSLGKESSSIAPALSVSESSSPSEVSSSLISSLSSSSSTSEKLISVEECSTTKKSQVFARMGYETLFSDINFRNGFRVSKSSTSADGGPYYSEYLKPFTQFDQTPSWTLCQWNSAHNLYEDGYTISHSLDNLEYEIVSLGGDDINGTFVPAKKLDFNVQTGSLYLEANTQVEYEHPRENGEGWVHLLLEQDFSNNLVQLSSLDSLYMATNLTIEKFEDAMEGKANTSLHAAQVVWYITLQNRNLASSSYGSYIWFGVNLWDNRTSGKVTSLYASHDNGTSTFIYNPSSSYFYINNDGKQPQVGEQALAMLDVMSVAQKAYDLAKERGYLGTTQFDDLYVGGMNFGFEIPGTYNLGVRFDDIGVYYKNK